MLGRRSSLRTIPGGGVGAGGKYVVLTTPTGGVGSAGCEVIVVGSERTLTPRKGD